MLTGVNLDVLPVLIMNKKKAKKVRDKKYYLRHRDILLVKVKERAVKLIQYKRNYDRDYREKKAEKVKENKYRWMQSEKCLSGKRKYYLQNLNRHRCKGILNYAIRKGEFERKPCIICGKEGLSFHKEISKPFEVIWLCKRHHEEIRWLLKKKYWDLSIEEIINFMKSNKNFVFYK